MEFVDVPSEQHVGISKEKMMDSEGPLWDTFEFWDKKLNILTLFL